MSPHCNHEGCQFDTDFRGEIRELLGEIRSDVKKLYRTVEGNGQPGLRQRVEMLEKNDSNSAGRKAVWAIVISAILTLSTMAYHIYQDAKAERGAVHATEGLSK